MTKCQRLQNANATKNDKMSQQVKCSILSLWNFLKNYLKFFLIPKLKINFKSVTRIFLKKIK